MRSAAPCRVVVIDDNEDAANSLCELLQLMGCEVLVAFDGREGINAVVSIHPQVVLCDLGLPGLDGFAVARALRDQVGYATTLVAVTGFASAADARRAIEAGFDYHLPKPFDLEQLRSILALATGSREADAAADPA